MNAFAPMAMPAPAGPTFAPAPVPFAGPTPSYGMAPMTNVPLTPLIVPSDMLAEEAPGLSSGGGGGFVTKIFALPLIIILPILLVVVVVVVVAGGGGGGGGGFLRRLFGFPPKYQQYEETTPYYDYPAETTPPTDYNGPSPYPGQRKRRAAEKESSSGLPSMTIAQVERMTEVVFAAMRSQECIQRLLCEVGSLSKSYSDTAHSVAKAVEQFVPESIKESYDVFTKAEKCEQYRCGTLQVKK